MALLICGMFNASVSAEELVKKYEFNDATQSWYLCHIM